jgi:hypothetical protein
MALGLPVPTWLGIEAEYHRIEEVHIYADTQEVRFVIGSYVSAETRQEGALPLKDLQDMVLPFSAFPIGVIENIRKHAYEGYKAGCGTEYKPESVPDFREAQEV